jgi:hypothetical protein
MGCSPHTTFRECTHPVVTGTTKGHANQVCHRRVIIDYQDIPGQFPRLTEVSAGIKRFNISFQLDSFVRAKDPTGSFKGREEYVPHSRSGYYLVRPGFPSLHTFPGMFQYSPITSKTRKSAS